MRLLNRTTRKIGLTTIGSMFYERSKQIVSLAEGALHEIDKYRDDPGGTVTISCAIALGRLHLIPALNRFLALHPKISVDVQLSERFADLVTSPADVVIRSAEEPHLMALVARKLASIHWNLCATPKYLETHGVPQAPADLVHHNCLVYSTNRRREWVFIKKDEVRTIRVKGNFRANSADGVLVAVLDHLGIAILPTIATAQYLRDGRLVNLLPDYQLPTRTLYAAYLPNLPTNHTIKLLVDFLITEFGEKPYWDADIFN